MTLYDKNYLTVKDSSVFKSDTDKLEAFAHEYNSILRQIVIPNEGIYALIMMQNTITRQSLSNDDVYVKPFGIIVAEGIITNYLKGIDFLLGDIRLDSRKCYHNHYQNNCKNYKAWLHAMIADREFEYAGNRIVSSIWDISSSCLDRLRTLILGPVEWIRFEMNCITVSQRLRELQGTFDNDFYEEYPGIYVGYKGLRIRGIGCTQVTFGPFIIPEEQIEIAILNKENSIRLDELMQKYEKAHPKASFEERWNKRSELSEAYNLNKVYVPKHYDILPIKYSKDYLDNTLAI